jgi:hypothetical protein
MREAAPLTKRLRHNPRALSLGVRLIDAPAVPRAAGIPPFMTGGTMSPRTVIRMTSAGFVLGGVLVAAWTTISPWGSFAGPHLGASLQWRVAHTCHFLAALCLLFGLVGLAVQRLARAGRFEIVAQLSFLVALWVYAGTGAITAFIWPMISEDAGYIVEPNGAMFKPEPEFLSEWAPPLLSIGLALLAIAMRRARLMPLGGLIVTLVGAVFFWVPTAPIADFPWIFFAAAGVFAGLGMVWLGLSLRQGAVAPEAPPVVASVPSAAEPAVV